MKLKSLLKYNYLFILLFLFIFVYCIINIYIIDYKSLYNIDDTYIEGIVIDYDYKVDKINFTIKGKEKILGTYYIKDNNINIKNIIGSKIYMKGKINSVSNNTIDNTFNYKEYLNNNKIYYTFTISSFEYKESNNIIYKIKNYFYNKLYDNNKVNEYLNLFILGNKSYLDNDTYNNYLNNGISHLFSISGMHISFLVYFLDKIIPFRRKRIFINILLFLYAFIVSFPISILRTVIYYLLKTIIDYLNIDISNIKILLLDLFILLIINPFNIFNIGLLYSFVSVSSIMLYSKKTNNYFKDLLIVSFITFIFNLPITSSINYKVNILSIINNLIFIPLVTFIIYPLSIITFILPIFNNIYLFFINILEYINNLFSTFSINIIIPKINIIIWFIYYIIIYLYFNKIKIIYYIVFIIMINLFIRIDSNYYINVFDVKQGDSVLLISKYKKDVILIDTGGIYNSNVSSNIIKYLNSIGINKIDSLVLTHGDYDHMGDARYVVNNIKVDNVIFNCGIYNELESELISILNKNNIEYYSCLKELNIDKYKLVFLNNKDYGNENDNSSVIYFDYEGYKFLFMGDAGKNVEEDIVNKYNLNNIDFLKVGHHGSKTSSSKYFIDNINPKYSLISVGKNNRYGHPNKEVLSNLENTKIYRTDIDGSIMFSIKNNKLKIETCSP